MKYLIDSDVLIDNLRQKVRLEEEIVEAGATSIINLGELVYGAAKSVEPEKAFKILDDFIGDLGIEIINLDTETIYVFGKLKADLEIKGEKLDDFDLLIAAVALVNNLILVTRNIKHFKRIKGLKIYKEGEL